MQGRCYEFRLQPSYEIAGNSQWWPVRFMGLGHIPVIHPTRSPQRLSVGNGTTKTPVYKQFFGNVRKLDIYDRIWVMAFRLIERGMKQKVMDIRVRLIPEPSD